ncbi:hypothetical protein SAY86_023865 [Trapa natans]|uniref:Clp R domain-containing protein n=1 Tax=Trapa natans TaxID=22666 RepID=A0AAN7R9Q0_TRANT|nr:hypothetical protein SAY86_023865 [Trapa natans]
MRAGICSIQQAFTVDALAVVKQAAGLARRRGHAQVTPLHVGSSMLAASDSLLRRACLHSHSHPLQCKALELCFNVALNRLPTTTTTPSPLLGSLHHFPHPSLSNALVAAFKRAQANQRRGSIENQQQPILALKIEIEQLVISILDDPSVSRIMREAGFSSTHVKTRVEQTVSVESSVKNSPPNKETAAKPLSVHLAQLSNEDVQGVLNAMVSEKRNTVVVGEELNGLEGVVRGVVNAFERGLVPPELRLAQLISLPIFSLRNSSREEVEQKVAELRSLVKSCIGRGIGIVFYLGDLQGVSESWSSYTAQRKSYYHHYCTSLEFLIMEIKKLVCGYGESVKRIWLMAIATFRSYMKCKSGCPPLEDIWDLHPFITPAGSLSLSLKLDSELNADSKSKVLINGSTEVKDWNIGASVGSSLPPWLQQIKNEKSIDYSNHHKEDCTASVKSLCEKWNSYCNNRSSPQDNTNTGKRLKFYSTPSSPTTSFSSPEGNSSFFHSQLSWPAMIEFKQLPKPDLLSNPNSSPNSASSSEVADNINDTHPTFKEYNSDNIKVISDALLAKVPWQRDAILEVVETVLRCRSGRGNKKLEGPARERHQREDTWMLFLGADKNAKENTARELAKLVFGSQGNFISIGPSRKRPRNEQPCFNHLQMLGEAVNENPHRVFFLEGLDRFDYSSKLSLKWAAEGGEISVSGVEMVSLQDAIVIMCCESLGPAPGRKKVESEPEQPEKGTGGRVSLDLNMAIDEEDEGIDQMITDCMDRRVVFELVDQV